MKKIISVLILLASVMMLSSCFWIIDDDATISRYDITCNNDTLKKITDWCVKQDNDRTYANSEYNCEILSGKSDKITNLKKGYYSICISFAVKSQLHPDDYEETNLVYLDEDVTFSVAERKYYGRSVSTTIDENEEPEYVVIINGKEYPLVKSNN